jgi:hypothetical protein
MMTTPQATATIGTITAMLLFWGGPSGCALGPGASTTVDNAGLLDEDAEVLELELELTGLDETEDTDEMERLWLETEDIPLLDELEDEAEPL